MKTAVLSRAELELKFHFQEPTPTEARLLELLAQQAPADVDLLRKKLAAQEHELQQLRKEAEHRVCPQCRKHAWRPRLTKS
jgi:hypothetical protein